MSKTNSNQNHTRIMIAAVLCMQLIFAVSVNAKEVEIQELHDANKVWEYNKTEPETTVISFDAPDSGIYGISFDMTLHTLLKEDEDMWDGRARNSFYIEIAGRDLSRAGGVFHVQKQLSESSMSFHWKTTQSIPVSFEFKQDISYHILMQIGLDDQITLIIQDKDGNELYRQTDFSMRAVQAHGDYKSTAGNVIISGTAREGKTDSVQIDNMCVYKVFNEGEFIPKLFIKSSDYIINNNNTQIEVSTELKAGIHNSNANIYTALYKNDVLEAWNILPVVLSAGEELTCTAAILADLQIGSEYYYKIFIWDNTMLPLCKPFISDILIPG